MPASIAPTAPAQFTIAINEAQRVIIQEALDRYAKALADDVADDMDSDEFSVAAEARLVHDMIADLPAAEKHSPGFVHDMTA